MITQRDMNKLLKISNMGLADFANLWRKAGGSEKLMTHIWMKMTQYNRNILTLWAYADSKNRKIIIKMVNML